MLPAILLYSITTYGYYRLFVRGANPPTVEEETAELYRQAAARGDWNVPQVLDI